MRFVSELTLSSSLAMILAASGCGSIEYGDDEPSEVAVQTSGGAHYVVQQAPEGYGHRRPHRRHRHHRQRVVVVPPQVQPQVQYEQRSPAGQGALRCSGRDRLRIVDRVVDGGGGPGVVASGSCRLDLIRSAIRGQPAVVVQGNARVRIIASQVEGDVVSSGRGRVRTRGTAHRGRVLHGAF